MSTASRSTQFTYPAIGRIWYPFRWITLFGPGVTLFYLPGSKPACEVRSCHLMTLYTSHLHTSNLYDNRSLNMIITPGVGWALFDWLSIRSSLYYCASCILIIFSPYVHIFRWIIVVAGGAKMNLIFIEHLKFNKAIQMFYGCQVHLSSSGCYK